jgi:hypothetical protein
MSVVQDPFVADEWLGVEILRECIDDDLRAAAGNEQNNVAVGNLLAQSPNYGHVERQRLFVGRPLRETV